MAMYFVLILIFGLLGWCIDPIFGVIFAIGAAIGALPAMLLFR